MESKRVSTTFDQYGSEETFPIFRINDVPMMDVELKGNDLISSLGKRVINVIQPRW